MRNSFNIKNIIKLKKPRGRSKIWLICGLFVVFTAVFGVVDHTETYIKVAENTNKTLEDAGIPGFLRLPGEKDYSLGLDLVGGVRLVYSLDVSEISGGLEEQEEAVNSLRDVIERRVNAFGVREPLVQIQGRVPEARLIVELSGIDNPEEAIEEIGKTPFLEFKELRSDEGSEEYFAEVAEKYNKSAREQQEQQANGEDVQELVVRTGGVNEDGEVEIEEVIEAGKEDASEEGVGEKENEVGTEEVPTEDSASPSSEEEVIDEVASEEDSIAPIAELTTEGIATENENPDDVEENSDETTIEETVESEDDNNSEAVTVDDESEEVEEQEVVEITGEQVRDLCSSSGQEGNFNAFVLRSVLQQRDGEDYEDPCFVASGLDGRYLDNAEVRISSLGIVDIVLNFNKEGGDLFEEITENNVSKPVAIFLDNQLINSPNVQEKISGGTATVSGDFRTIEDIIKENNEEEDDEVRQQTNQLERARRLVSNLNAGALPVPIEIISQQQIGPSLGQKSVDGAMQAGMFGILAVFVFMIVVYRLSGILAVISLMFYISILLFVIKMFSVTLTLAGIAGIILSIGMAVDANVLVFERLREELKERDSEVPMRKLIDNAFRRTWSAILDGNLSTIITAIILYFFSTSFIKGFALTLGIGVVLSMFSAMIVTKYLMYLFTTPFFARRKLLWSRILKYDN